MSVRFLHAADLHLGLRLTRFDPEIAGRIAEARFIALQNLAEQARRLKVDFTVIAGDLFDDPAVSSAIAERAFALLEGSSWGGPVYIIPGNHDPIVPGSVWDRDPWQREQPHLRVRLLRSPEPVEVPDKPCVLFPCPLRYRRSVDDPTAWIARFPRQDRSRIRIGIAHGSLKYRASLPEDDHLIPTDVADRLDLDYLALGHWHRPQAFSGNRVAYSGTTEPMRFPEESATESTGWQPYSQDVKDDRFADGGEGTAYLVEIDGPGVEPRLTLLNVGHLRWSAETIDLTSRSIGEVVSEFATKTHFERTLLKLRLTGVIEPQADKRLDELKNVVLHRFHPGTTVDDSAVKIQPTEEQILAAVGDGVLARVLEQLRKRIASGKEEDVRTAEHALKILYRLAFEDQPA